MISIRTTARLSQSLRPCPSRLNTTFSRFYSSEKSDSTHIEAILGAPNWSVRSLLPNPASKPPPSVTPKQLHHLLRISALPQPANQEEEQSMLDTLESQIHFVKEIQLVDTTGVAPLARIRDESPAAMEEETIGIERLREALAKEKVSGRRGKIQRVPGEKNDRPDGTAWDGNALGSATKTKGKYFVVEIGN
ncbi:Aspartyl/glutamyl-tRNA(Asn/Gln) amidotransferase C subunit [Penicillium robsamsonii]|uniref:Aspartyl/glutamyl-tRNA(Asn/Gln) amidotransferase C subunit n=1 Tax=Penicillium robsamsonii TaxID=1792511 RepID=UPI0025484B64|nr:Aspartyl/glutamyl-tRNA(Asn/Gln) amidotransferase C subunit [Penicillium robsamsonii]KAJ5835890.1 Aspartyl/glutamyl-tRNA(Asn/Gln) amidotransferase C subunit [Penicillium robsamsonii]